MYTLEFIIEKIAKLENVSKKTEYILTLHVSDNVIIVLKRAIKARHQHGKQWNRGF